MIGEKINISDLIPFIPSQKVDPFSASLILNIRHRVKMEWTERRQRDTESLEESFVQGFDSFLLGLYPFPRSLSFCSLNN